MKTKFEQKQSCELFSVGSLQQMVYCH